MTARPATSLGPAAVWLALGLAVAIGLWQRVTPLAGAFLFGDELHSLGALGLPVGELIGRYDAVGSGLALPLLQKGLVALFGTSLPVLRAVAFIPSVALVAIAAQIARRRAGRAAAAAAAGLVALGPAFVFYGHFARSYSLTAALCVGAQLVCLGALTAEDDRSRRRATLAVAVLGGLAVWAHLVAVFFFVALGVGVVIALLTRGADARTVASHPLVAGLVAAAVLACVLHAPALESLLAFVGTKAEQVYSGGFGPLDVLAVLAGSRGGALAVAAASLAAVAAELRARGPDAALLIAPVLLPPALLWLVSPYGDAYAYARYLLPSAVSGAVLLAVGSARLGHAISARTPFVPAATIGLGLAAGLALAGPRGPWAPPLGPFANSYLGLQVLRPFTAGEPPAPEWYEGIVARDPRLVLVEVPPLRNRAVHYLAALWRWHGQDVRMGTFGPVVPGAPPIDSPLYVDLTRIVERPNDVDTLIVHRRIVDEVERYWVQVYAPFEEGRGGALLERHRRYGHDLPSVARGVVDRLESILGPPSHEDVDVVVWQLTLKSR